MYSRGEPYGVLIVATGFGWRGGLTREMTMLAKSLSRRLPVTILTWGSPLRVETERLEQNLALVRVPALVPWHKTHPPWLARANTAFSVASGLAALVALRPRWSAVYAAGLYPEGFVAALAARALGRTCVIGTSLPGPLGDVASLEQSLVAPIAKRIIGRADALVAETQEVAEELAKARLPEERIRVVVWGIPLDEFVPADREARLDARLRLGIDGAGVVAYCGRFTLRQKRLDVLLKAWKLARMDGWRLVLVGDGPDRSFIERLSGEIEPPPILLSWRDDVRPVLRAADVFVLPTDFETTGLSMVEAMACGLPGIVSATSAYMRLRPNGVILVPNDPRAWADALTRLAADERERAALGAQARDWAVAHHDVRRTISDFENLLGL